MAGMTHVQYRNFLLGEIKSSYREYATAQAKVLKYTNGNRAQLAIEWGGRMKKAERALGLAFNELPEVKAGKVDMTAIEFAKSLIEQPAAPEYLPGQRDFLEASA